MILLATFVATADNEFAVAVPSIEVTQMKVPPQADGLTYSPVKTKKLCEAMGREYVNSISATLPSGTTVVMSCIGQAKVDFEDNSAS